MASSRAQVVRNLVRSEGGVRQLQAVRVEHELRSVSGGQVHVRVFAGFRTQVRARVVPQRRVGRVRQEAQRVHVSKRGGVCRGGTCEGAGHFEGTCGCGAKHIGVQGQVPEGLFVCSVYKCK